MKDKKGNITMKINNQKPTFTPRLLALKELMDPIVYGDTYITKDLATILITHMKDYTLELERKFGNPKVEEKRKKGHLKKVMILIISTLLEKPDMVVLKLSIEKLEIKE